MRNFLLYVFGLFVLFSCTSNNRKTENVPSVSKQVQIVEEGKDLMIHVVDDEICFPCSPAFMQAILITKKSGIDKENIVYLFPDMREVKRRAFFEKNFRLNFDEYRVIFNTELYDEIRSKHNLKKAAYLLKYKNGAYKAYPYTEHEAITIEMKKAIESF